MIFWSVQEAIKGNALAGFLNGVTRAGGKVFSIHRHTDINTFTVVYFVER